MISDIYMYASNKYTKVIKKLKFVITNTLKRVYFESRLNAQHQSYLKTSTSNEVNCNEI